MPITWTSLEYLVGPDEDHWGFSCSGHVGFDELAKAIAEWNECGGHSDDPSDPEAYDFKHTYVKLGSVKEAERTGTLTMKQSDKPGKGFEPMTLAERKARQHAASAGQGGRYAN